jgi:hypothetical protein
VITATPTQSVHYVLDAHGSVQRGDMWQCPAHDDRNPSLSVSAGADGRVLLHCHAGCAVEDVLSALGLTLADLMPASESSGNGYHRPTELTPFRPLSATSRVVAEYTYTDESGSPLFVVERHEPKGFRQRRADGVRSMTGVRLVPYRLPEVLRAVAAGQPVFVVEGEKDADNLVARGFTATCNPMGADKWRDEYTETLRGADVFIVADDDDPGHRHAHNVATALDGVARSVVTFLPADGCKDVTEHLEAGNTVPSGLRIVDVDSVAETTPDTFELAVDREVDRLRVREEATRRVRASTRQRPTIPEFRDLVPYCAEPDDPEVYRVDRLWPTGGRVLLAAGKKAGKTTLVANLTRSLVTGESFLGHARVTKTMGPLVVLDFEMSGNTLRRWWRSQGIHESNRVVLVPLRGRVTSFDILDAECRAEWATRLSVLDTAVVVLDCLGPSLAAHGLDENSNADVGRYLAAFDELLDRAGVGEALVVHHMGHGGERSRGASRLGDWPDATWKLVQEATDSGDPDLSQPRYFSAFGRDVDEPETALLYDPLTRRLTMGIGNRGEGKVLRLADAVVEYIRHHEGCSQREIERGIGGQAGTVRDACRLAVANRRIWTEPGPKNAHRHWLTRAGLPVKPSDQGRPS